MRHFLFFIFSIITFYANAQTPVEKEVLGKLNSIHYPIPLKFEVSSCNSEISGKSRIEILLYGDNIKDDGSLTIKEFAAGIFGLAYVDCLSKYPNYDHVIFTLLKSGKKVKIDFYIIGKDILRVDEKGDVKPVTLTKT